MTLPPELHWIDNLVRMWAVWSSKDRSEIQRMCGYKSSSAGFDSGGGGYDTIDEMAEEEDLKICRKVDSAVRGLSGQHWAAICNQYLAKVAKHRGDPVAVLLEALRLIEASVIRKGVIKW